MSTELSTAPLEVATTWGSRMWQLRRTGDTVIFEGRSFFWHIAWGLLAVPIVYAVCGYFQAAQNLQIGLSFFPLFYAGGMAVGVLVMTGVPHLELDLNRKSITLLNGAHLPFDSVVAIQLIETQLISMQRNGKADRSVLFHYQVNLCYRIREQIQRLNLVQCHDELTTLNLARTLANDLKTPVHIHYLPKQTILDCYQRGRSAEFAAVVVSGLFLVMSAAIITMAIIGQPNWNWKDRLWQLIALPACLFVTSLLAFVRRRTERDRRLSRSQHHDGEPVLTPATTVRDE